MGDEGTTLGREGPSGEEHKKNKGDLFPMAENICLVLATSGNFDMFTRVLELGVEALDLNKRTVLYLEWGWQRYARASEKEKYGRETVELFRRFQQAGGQLWVSPFKLDQKKPLVEGATVVDDK